jgi:hypothetical protein
MAGKTLFIKNIRLTSLVIEIIGFVSSVPAARLTLDILVGTLSTKGNKPIFHVNVTSSSSLNLGLPNATKNMTF